MLDKYTKRKIIHVDMDAFYAAVEIRDNPSLKGKPVIVGSPPKRRGVVSTCSYEARKYGIHSAMPSTEAFYKCPHAIFVKPNFSAYEKASKQIREIFFEYTDLVEPLSLDEAYLDVTENKRDIPSATWIAKEIKKKIKAKTKLTASAGVSYNKFLAKIASDWEKPDGLTVITPDKAEEFLRKLKIKDFYGIGKVTAKKMIKKGIKNGADLRKWHMNDLVKEFGKMGLFYYQIVRGIDKREVKAERERKSLGKETTFSEDLSQIEDMLDILDKLSEKISKKLDEKRIKGRTITLKIKYADFKVNTCAKSFSDYVSKKEMLFNTAKHLLVENLKEGEKVRLLGISVSNLLNSKEEVFQPLFSFFENYPITFDFD